MKNIVFLLLLLQFCCCIGIAQVKPVQQLRFNYIGVKDGLPESQVNTIVQDREGYFWIGTQNGLVRFDGYRIKKYALTAKTENSNIINFVCEDKESNIWIGTFNGLYVYDRKKDSVIQQSFFSSSYNTKRYVVLFIQFDKEDNIWLQLFDDEQKSTCAGLLSRKTKHFTLFGVRDKANPDVSHTDYFSSFADEHIDYFSSFVDEHNNFWVQSNNCLIKYNPVSKIFKRVYFDTANTNIYWYENEDSFNHSEVWFLIADKKSNQPKGLGRYDINTNTLVTFQHPGIKACNAFGDIAGMNFIDSQRHVWFATENGLTSFDPSTQILTDFNLKDKKTNPFDNAIFWAIENKEGEIWCWGGKGIVQFDTKTKDYIRYNYNEKDAKGILSNTISHISLDQQGHPWFGSEFMGLQWFNKDQSKFVVYENEPGYIHYFPGGDVNSFAEMADGSFWLGSLRGLYHWLPQTDSFIYTNFDNRINKSTTVSSVIIARDGMLWFTALNSQNVTQGLYCYNPVTKKTKNYRYNKDDHSSLGSNSINCILEDNTGTIWVGLNDSGLCRFNNQDHNFTRYPFIAGDRFTVPKSEILDDKAVVTMYLDTKNALWIGTRNGGLNKFNSQAGSFTSYLNTLPGLFSTTCIFEDNKKNIWAGSYVGGLFLLNKSNNTIKKFSEKNGLLYDGTLGINEDDKNNMWITSPRGISILNSGNDTIKTIVPDNGLLEYPLYRGLFKTSKGLMMYGCKNGFVSFNPDDFVPDTTLPIVHIESVSFKSKKDNLKDKDSSIVKWSKDKIYLRYDENRVLFNYVALLYQNTFLIKYAYRLDGYDKDWIWAGTQRTATYTNLSPGTYTFHVKAANSDGIWTTKEDSITVIISPPWWKTWWAYLLYAVIFLVAISSVIVYRSRNLKKQNLLLEQKVTNRTQQLNQSLEELKSTQAQLIQSEKMASLGEITAGIAHEIQNPLNFVNNFSEVSSELLNEMKEELQKDNKEDAIALADNIKQNLEKINHHGKRADAIVKGMLQHSRKNTGQKEWSDINALCDEYLRLSYHGLRAKDKNFNAEYKTEFDERIGKINIVPQDIGRVLLNLFNNAFYAVNEKKKTASEDYKPIVSVNTKRLNDKVEIIVSDNGNGILQTIIDKIFQPFFTTKPTGQGTGLGLSLSYDIITKEHNGTIKVESKEGEETTFIITLPV